MSVNSVVRELAQKYREAEGQALSHQETTDKIFSDIPNEYLEELAWRGVDEIIRQMDKNQTVEQNATVATITEAIDLTVPKQKGIRRTNQNPTRATSMRYPELLNQVIVEGNPKFLGDCSPEDHLYLANKRYALATAINEEGLVYQGYAELLVKHNAKSLNTLPQVVLDKLFPQKASV